MMKEFAVFASALERFATASSHHLDRMLCGVGTGIANPSCWEAPIQTLIANGHCRDR
jgi:hypothetical protein